MLKNNNNNMEDYYVRLCNTEFHNDKIVDCTQNKYYV